MLHSRMRGRNPQGPSQQPSGQHPHGRPNGAQAHPQNAQEPDRPAGQRRCHRGTRVRRPPVVEEAVGLLEQFHLNTFWG